MPSAAQPLPLVASYAQNILQTGLRPLDEAEALLELQQVILVLTDPPDLVHAVLGNLARVNMQAGYRVAFGCSDPQGRVHRLLDQDRRHDRLVPGVWEQITMYENNWRGVEERVENIRRQDDRLALVVVDDITALKTPLLHSVREAKQLARGRRVAVALGISKLPVSWPKNRRLLQGDIGAPLGDEDHIVFVDRPRTTSGDATVTVVRARTAPERTFRVSLEALLLPGRVPPTREEPKGLTCLSVIDGDLGEPDAAS